MQRAKRCGARTRSGKSCQSPGMANGRCRMHGGSSPGAPKGNQHAYEHGRYTAEVIANRRKIFRDAYRNEVPRRFGLRLNFHDVRSWLRT
ncbi:HGGxSTG domain-containing protein [Bradyrhizobium barranii]|uniref:HGGxSTG domain-containing protein n=1 Tax=Bradyrhizobium barranii TaxID=2992140 RepID=UPI002AB23140|nr:HGGxSTG domain-containing protein [Bradyrhizobium barranii]